MILRPLYGSHYVHSLGPKKSCASAVLSNVDLQMATNLSVQIVVSEHDARIEGSVEVKLATVWTD